MCVCAFKVNISQNNHFFVCLFVCCCFLLLLKSCEKGRMGTFAMTMDNIQVVFLYFQTQLHNVVHISHIQVFPYILHDVGVTSLSSNYFLFNSGLMFASRHPVLNADFKFYKHSVSQCRFTSKGLLMVKVRERERERERERVRGCVCVCVFAYKCVSVCVCMYVCVYLCV